MFEESSVDIFRLPNPGNFLIFTLLTFLFLGLVILTGTGIYNLWAYNNLLDQVLFSGTHIDIFLSLLKAFSLNTIFLPATSNIYLWTTVILKPLYMQLRYSPLHADSDLTIRFQSALSRMGIKQNLKLQVSNKKVATQIYNFWNPTIILSKSKISNYTREETEAIFLHEIAHYKNKDIYAVEITKAFIFTLFVQFVITLTLLALIFLSLVYALINNSKIYTWNENDLTTAIDFLVKILSTDIAVPFVLLVSIIVLLFSLQAISTYRERRADIRVRFVSPDSYHALIGIIARGTKQPNIFEKLLEIGSDRWTRHESLIDPRRLLRPNLGFVVLFGLIWATLIYTGGGVVAYLQGILDLPERISRTTNLVMFWLSDLFYFSFFVWMMVSLLSSRIGENNPKGFRRIFTTFAWYLAMNFIFGASAGLLYLLLGVPLIVIAFSIIPWLIPLLSITAWLVITSACLVQDLVLDSYLVIPMLRKNLSLWLVYFPFTCSVVLVLIVSLISYWSRPEFNNEYISWIVNIATSTDYSNLDLDTLFEIYTRGSTTITFSQWFSQSASFLIVYLMFLVGLFIVNAGLEKCCCCGADAKDGFSVSYECKNCRFPLGLWITSKQLPSMELYHTDQQPFDWKFAAIHNITENIILVSFMATPIAAALLSYYIFSSDWAESAFSDWFLQLILGIIAFIPTTLILMIIVALLIYLFWREFFFEIFKKK